MRTIQWPDETEPDASPDRPDLGRVARTPTTMAVATAMMDANTRSGYRARDVVALVLFVAILLLLGVLLLYFEPLPRIFPAAPGGLYVPR